LYIKFDIFHFELPIILPFLYFGNRDMTVPYTISLRHFFLRITNMYQQYVEDFNKKSVIVIYVSVGLLDDGRGLYF